MVGCARLESTRFSSDLPEVAAQQTRVTTRLSTSGLACQVRPKSRTREKERKEANVASRCYARLLKFRQQSGP